MAKFEIVPGLKFVDRKGWGADPAHPRRGHRVKRDRRTHVIIHHTVLSDSSDTSPNIWETEAETFKTMRRLQVIRPDLGNDVPYNFVAFPMAGQTKLVICEGRGEDRTGAHTKGHNTQGIAVAFCGNFHDLPVPGLDIAKRMYLLSYFLGWLRFDPSHPSYGDFAPMVNLDSLRAENRQVFFHRDFKATACPGDKLIPYLSQLTFLDPAQA